MAVSQALIEAIYEHRELVEEIADHNAAVTIARRRGEEAPPYRWAIAEVSALTGLEA